METFFVLCFSLRMHHSNLVSGSLINRSSTNGSVDSGCWYTDRDFVSAAWALLDLCSITNEYSSDNCALAADFLSRVCFSLSLSLSLSIPSSSMQGPLDLLSITHIFCFNVILAMTVHTDLFLSCFFAFLNLLLIFLLN
jgi:hypothetical protein